MDIQRLSDSNAYLGNIICKSCNLEGKTTPYTSRHCHVSNVFQDLYISLLTPDLPMKLTLMHQTRNQK